MRMMWIINLSRFDGSVIIGLSNQGDVIVPNIALGKG